MENGLNHGDILQRKVFSTWLYSLTWLYFVFTLCRWCWKVKHHMLY